MKHHSQQLFSFCHTDFSPYCPQGIKYIDTFTNTIPSFIDHPNHAQTKQIQFEIFKKKIEITPYNV